mgnify:CR=1 FL=1
MPCFAEPLVIQEEEEGGLAVENVLNRLQGRVFQGRKPVEIAELDGIPDFLIVCDVSGNLLEFFIGSPVQVDTDAKGPAHGAVHAEMQGDFSLVHAKIIGEPGPHVFDGIKIAVGFLDEKPVERVCVVAGPVLVETLQRAIIHPASTGSAGLQFHLRMAFFQLLCEPVDTFSAAEMQFFPLPQVPGGRAYFREIAVHVPFDVVDGVLGEQVVQNLDTFKCVLVHILYKK